MLRGQLRILRLDDHTKRHIVSGDHTWNFGFPGLEIDTVVLPVDAGGGSELRCPVSQVITGS